uniref:Uncharacterized protein n=1 Tax=Tanacetum cinerariifolium TaxID=118510 RepID=A0A699Q2X0_TANCI|nr:hypothetical protein [Tanacetum cinerariifolium]
MIITEATIRDALRLDYAEGVECLPNEEIFAELAGMGYEKRTSWNEFSSSMASVVICLSTGKGCSGVETPLFERMIVEQQVGEGAADVNVEVVSTAGVAAEGDVSVADDEVLTVDKPSIPSPTPPTPPLQPSQDQPLTSHVQLTPPQSPQAQP